MKEDKGLKSPTNIFDEALKIAEMAHAGQFRKDGKTPYISHIYAVIENTKKILSKLEGIDKLYARDFEDGILSVAALHDVIEDTEFNEDYLNTKLKDYNYLYVIEAVVALTKKPKGQEEYADYLTRVVQNEFARIVKLADLQHNISDLPPGNLRDKYSISILFLSL